MIFGRKKESAIDRRLRELQKEAGKIGADMKSLSRYAKAKENDPAPAQPPSAARLPVPESVATGAMAPAQPDSSAAVEQPSSGPDDLLSQEQVLKKENSFFPDDAARGGSGDMPLFEPRNPLSPTGREKFANYFMAGHFTNLRPLRQEKRIVRNKAIFMSVLAVIVLVWVIYFLYNR